MRNWKRTFFYIRRGLLRGGILRDATGAVRLSMGSGEPRQQDDALSDFRHGDCLCNRKYVLWQGIA